MESARFLFHMFLKKKPHSLQIVRETGQWFPGMSISLPGLRMGIEITSYHCVLPIDPIEEVPKEIWGLKWQNWWLNLMPTLPRQRTSQNLELKVIRKPSSTLSTVFSSHMPSWPPEGIELEKFLMVFRVQIIQNISDGSLHLGDGWHAFLFLENYRVRSRKKMGKTISWSFINILCSVAGCTILHEKCFSFFLQVATQ